MWGGSEMSDPVKYVLAEERIPKAWYNITADLPQPPPPVLHPGTGQPIGPDDLAPLFPMALIGQEVSTEREIEIPGPVRDVYRLWRPTPLFSGARAGTRPRDAGPDLLQVRRGQPGGKPQAEHGGRPGLLQQGRGDRAPGHRNRRRAVGVGAGVRGRAFRARDRRLHGARQLRAETLPQGPHGNLRRTLRGQPERGDRGRPRDPRQGPGVHGQPRDRHLGGGGGRGPERRHQVFAWQRAQPRAPASDGGRPRGDRADGNGGRLSRHRGRGARAAAATSPAASSPSWDASSATARTCASSPPSRPRAPASRVAGTHTTSAIPAT